MNDIRAININSNRMKHLFPTLLLLLCAGFVSCDKEYDADTAESLYQPVPGKRLVASVKTTIAAKGGEDIHEHNFTYDAQERIKAVRSNLVIHTPVIVNNNGFRDTIDTWYNMDSRADYFYRGAELEIAYTVSIEYPEYPGMNSRTSSSVYGTFNRGGVLDRFSQASFSYSATSLQKAYNDAGFCFEVTRSGGNVTGYIKSDAVTESVLDDKSGSYHYTSLKNNTNFDFSAYFGYWGVEQCVSLMSNSYRAPFRLAAFGMLGATSPKLPLGVIESDADGNEVRLYGEWELDGKECPVSYVDPDGRRTVITYNK